jgi:phage gp36-like protein
MAFIVKADLQIVLYPEIIDEIIRKLTHDFATQADFPATGISNIIYKELSSGSLFSWTGTNYTAVSDPDAIITRIINAGIAEVKGYLSRYDVTVLFDGTTLSDTVTEFLKSITIDVIVWRLVKIAQPNIDLKLMRTSYEDAISWLTKVQQGKVDPDGWPYKSDDPNTPDFNESNAIQSSSNTKRRQHF